MNQFLFFLLILACPLMMIFMMRGGHGAHGGHAGTTAGGRAAGSQHDDCEHDDLSIDELKRQRADIDRAIAAREASEYGDRTLEPTR